jgi:hypothetical protein
VYEASSIHGPVDLSLNLDSARHSLYVAGQIGKFVIYRLLLRLRRIVARVQRSKSSRISSG